MVNPPAVTVICATYNRRQLLGCALRSVLNQAFADFEVRVIGDACTDGSEEIISGLADPRLHWTNLPANSGTQTAPNNEGLRQARGKLIAFIGHDDLWLPGHLSRLVKKIEESGADFVHDITASVAPQGVESVSAAPHPQAGYAKIYVPTSSWLHRRELIESIGGWRHFRGLSWPIDFDFTKRAALAGKKFAFQPSLGVLKFHSHTWKCYSQQGEPAQERWLDLILRAPAALTEQILCEAAAQYALSFQFDEKIPFHLARDHAIAAGKRAAKALVREMTLWYGPERWPVGPLLRRRYRKIYSRRRAPRGLPPFRPEQL
jgi:glycosyltransferase involved in cell wall biosynthesis